MAKSRLKFVIITLLVLFLFSFIISSVISLFVKTTPFGNVALIPIKGVIVVEGSRGAFGEQTTSSSDVIGFIKDAAEDDSVEAILFEINSPGGSAVASKEIVDAIRRVNKSTYSVIRELGVSGSYWVASATDTIISNELSIVGSIGVISSYLEFSGFLEKYNISYQRLVAGKYKDIGSPLKTLEKDEEELLMQKLTKIHEYFIRSVSENRGMPVEELRILSTGEFFLGSEAYENGLVDVLGDMETAEALIKKEHNLTDIEFAEYTTQKTLIEMFSGLFSENSFFVGKGIGSALKESKTVNKISIIT